MAEVLRTVNEQGLTSCCGEFSTYVDETEVCKVCYEEVLDPDGGALEVVLKEEL